MSGIDVLLSKLCPEGVKFRSLGEVGTFVRGNGLQKKDFVDAGVGCIHYGQIHTHYGVSADRTLTFVSPALATRLRHARTGDLVIATTSEDNESVGKAVAWLGDDEIAVSSDAYIYNHTLNPKFVSYFFQSTQFREQKKPYITGSKVRRLSGESLAKIRIPVPPIRVQSEIVEVLDTFTELEAELAAHLEAELKARRQQYRHYRDAMLAFPEQLEKQAGKEASVLWTTLGEAGTFTRGRRFTNEDFVDSGVGCIHYGELYTHYGLAATSTKSFVRPTLAVTLRKACKGDLVIAGTGENVEEVCKAVAWLGDDEVAVHDDCYIFRHSLDPMYVAHYFRSGHFQRQKVRYAAGAKMIRVSGENLERIRIPVPPPAEQRRIAAILDRFDALVNDLSSRLPAELKARRQQYEYYRDRLLTFREVA